MGKRQVLGKGISALIPEAEQIQGATSLFYCPVALIRPNPHQPRRRFDEASLKELADSIKEKGLLAPLLVSKAEDGYVLIAGERRWRAAQLAGLERVPVVVREASLPELLELALVENLHREDLNPIEEAEAYRRLLEITGQRQEDLAKRLGRDRSTIANALRILKLPKDIQQAIVDGQITMGHARLLAGIQDPDRQRELLGQILSDGLSVRALENRVKKARSRQKTKGISPELKAVEERLKQALATKVEVKPSRRGGRMVLYFANQEELQRLVEILLGLLGSETV